MNDGMRAYGGPAGRTGFERAFEQALGWLRRRTTEEWLMFAAGLVIGLMIG